MNSSLTATGKTVSSPGPHKWPSKQSRKPSLNGHSLKHTSEGADTVTRPHWLRRLDKAPFHDKEIEQFVARDIERAPPSLEKLSIRDDIANYTTKDGAAEEFDALEFIAQLSCHIPKPYESITRYYGWYSCRRRGDRVRLFPSPAEEPKSDYRREFRKSS